MLVLRLIGTGIALTADDIQAHVEGLKLDVSNSLNLLRRKIIQGEAQKYLCAVLPISLLPGSMRYGDRISAPLFGIEEVAEEIRTSLQ